MSSATGTPPAGLEPAPRASSEPAAAPTSAPARTCSHCGGPLLAGQDWCLHCGAGAPGSLQRERWRASTAVACGVAVLALGAAAAAYAALKDHAPKPGHVEKLALVTPPATTPPAGTSTTPTTPTPSSPAHPKLPIPLQKTKLPKIPLTVPTPSKAGGTSSKEGSSGAGSTSKGSGASEREHSGEAGTGGGESSEPRAIMLDTNAASTYNPYSLPASYFGDPSLAIDGDTATAWTAEVAPATAPSMAEGVLLDLKSPQKVSVMKLDTQTLGMTVQAYGSTLSKPPESIVDPGWRGLSPPLVVRKHDTTIKLRHHSGYRYFLLWISKAPSEETGSAQAPGHVDVNELEVFPAS